MSTSEVYQLCLVLIGMVGLFIQILQFLSKKK